MNLRSAATSSPVLRLVGSGSPAELRPVVRQDQAAAVRQIASENRAASLRTDLDPTDPRWVLAAKTRRELQGAALPADRRQRLLSLAHQLGMRPFDANMVIAIVQDEARMTSGRAPLPTELADRLRIIPRRETNPEEPASRPPSSNTGDTPVSASLSISMAAGAILGVVGTLVLLRWLLGG